MDENYIENPVLHYVLLFGGIALALVVISLLLYRSLFTTPQGSVGVITRFGKYRRISLPGLSSKSPFFDSIFEFISTQNRSVELKFQAITKDQANVYFTAMLLYAVKNSEEETIKNAAFKFNSEAEFNTAVQKTIEGSIRSFVAGKGQSEMLTLRSEIVDHVRDSIEKTLSEWGYHLLDLQINDVSFDKVIMESMSQVVASSNLKAAAENQGQALLITKTKQAEAEGNAIKIQAAAEKEAAQLRGEGVAAFRKAVSHGIKESIDEVQIADGTDATQVIMFSMWTEAVKNFAELGKGNMIFLDGSPDGMSNVNNKLVGMLQKNFEPIVNGVSNGKLVKN